MEQLALKYSNNEIISYIYHAAKEGKLYRLKVLLDLKPDVEISTLVCAHTDGSTPLIGACKNGHLDIVLYLIEKCCADIEQVGVITVKGKRIDSAPPLWCAAAAGRLSIVKALIKHKASVNSTTKSGSTPLRAACIVGNLDITKYLIEHGADIEFSNMHGHTCLMLATSRGHYEICKCLLECGAEVNKKNPKGNTALHECAVSGNLEILKLLLNYGAKTDGDCFGTTPLMYAAMAGRAEIVSFFITETDCTINEEINAIELLGATLIDTSHYMGTALACWKAAMKLREKHGLIKNPNISSPISECIDRKEVRTFDQLEDLIADPDEIRIQALLVRERILGSDHPETIYNIRYRGSRFAFDGDLDRCIKLWLYALDVQQGVRKPLSQMILNMLTAFAQLFSYVMSESAEVLFMELQPLSFFDILSVFQRTIKEIEGALNMFTKEDLISSSHFHDTLIIALNLIGLMCKLQLNIDGSENFTLKKAVYKFVNLNPRTKNGFTLLHLACFRNSEPLEQFPVLKFPSLEIVNALLEVGANPNVVDLSNNTPLHIAAMIQPCPVAIFKSLLNYGAHLDNRNSENKTPVELAQNTPLLNIFPLKYLNLQCLCAQTINNCNICYNGKVSEQLNLFLGSHCVHKLNIED